MSLRLAMDADRLLKLTKAGLKERVCETCEVRIPRAVARETVDQALARPAAVRVKVNIEAGRLQVVTGPAPEARGEDAALHYSVSRRHGVTPVSARTFTDTRGELTR